MTVSAVTTLAPPPPPDDQFGFGQWMYQAYTIIFNVLQLAGLVLPITISNGGTGASTLAQAQANLEIPSFTNPLPIASGGTGGASLAQAQTNLEIPSFASPLPIASGGTNANNAPDALTNLGAFPLAGGTLTGNVIIDGAATPGFTGLDVNKNANAAAQITVYNANTGASATAEFNATTEGNADAVYRAVVNGGYLFTFGQDVSDSNAFVISTTNSLGSGNIFRIGQNGVPSFPVAPLPITSGGTNAITALGARTNLSAASSGTNTDITSIALNNTGLSVKDTDASHFLSFVPGSNLTANRTLTLTTGDNSRTLDVSAANVTVSAFGATLIDDADAATSRTTLGAAASGANTDITSIALNNTGLTIRDTDASHFLSFVPGSNLTANRTLTFITSDNNRTLDLSAANTTITALGAAITALTTLTQNGVIYGNAASAPSATAAGTSGQILIGNTSAAPSFASSLDGNFTYSSNTSGATRQVEVAHLQNAANSNALFKTSVSGATAGDPYFQSAVGGAQTWTFGLDNSDSDAFVLSSATTLGTTNVMRVTTTGEINYPLQPAFMAYMNTTITNATGDSTVANITGAIFTEIFDQSSSFSNGTLTADVTGRYQLNASVIFDNLGAAHTAGEFQIVTSNRTYRLAQDSPGACRSSANACSYSVAVLADMDVGDTASMALQISGSTKTVRIYGTTTPYTTFSGYLVA